MNATTRIQISAFAVKGLTIPAYSVARDDESEIDAIVRAIASKNGAVPAARRDAGRAADRSYRDYEVSFTKRDGRAIGSCVVRVR